MKGPNPNCSTLPSGNQGPLGPGGRYGYRKAAKRIAAEARPTRAAGDQIAELDRRLGAGVGAKAERERLEGLL